ncbi:hypothetical protein C0991_007822 [Blastosporella zonata]|nr:hypothetical protein C0991_007822 [Blastosporella zonata]
MSEDALTPEIQINVKGPRELKLQITITTDKSVKELKEAIAAQSDVEASRQRLIYSGRVLKDDDPLTTYKVQSGHTIHMVKGAEPSIAASSSTGSTTSGSTTEQRQQLPTMQTGQLPSDPLTQLNGHRGFGALAGVNPFADMGLNPNDPNMMQGMLNNPAFLQQMSAMMSNPEVIDQIIATSPQLAGNPEHARQMLNSPIMRGILSDPQALQQMLQMSANMQGGGNPFGMPGMGAGGGFPAPGMPGGAPAPTPAASNQNANQNANANPFLWGMGAPNPVAPGAGGAAANPWMNPALMQGFFGGGAGAGAGAAGFGAGLGAPAAPADTRPAEERFQVQLGQLNEMGFSNAAQNIQSIQGRENFQTRKNRRTVGSHHQDID